MSSFKHQKTLCWLRRDLRLEDQAALSYATANSEQLFVLFVFDDTVLAQFENNDPRIGFIYENLQKIHSILKANGGGLIVKRGSPKEIIANLAKLHQIDLVVANEDYEFKAIQRDQDVKNDLFKIGVAFELFKDQVIFSKNEITKADGKPYVVYTPYSKLWLKTFSTEMALAYPVSFREGQVKADDSDMPSFSSFGFKENRIKVKPYNLTNSMVSDYEAKRNFPSLTGTSFLGPHLRFGTISVRACVKKAIAFENQTFLKELIWREFFMQILWHYPHVSQHPFKEKYNGISWRNNEADFEKWCAGKTGYPIVDAGMRELNSTGYMHNRVRMITASFLCKHLLIDWRWGEAYFAQKLLDFDLAQNNGNWQWVAGTGCDAAPYFRIFNPTSQAEKFDKNQIYISNWVPELHTDKYPEPMVVHSEARTRCLEVYNEALKKVS